MSTRSVTPYGLRTLLLCQRARSENRTIKLLFWGLLFICSALVCPVPATAGPNAAATFTADMDPAAGDQGQLARAARPGDEVKIEVYAKKIAGSNGATITVQFDLAQVQYVSFTPGGIPGFFALPASPKGNIVTVGGGLLGSTFSGDQFLGTVTFKALSTFKEAKFTITEIAINSSGGQDKFTPNIVLTATPPAAPTPTGRDRIFGDLDPSSGYQGLTAREVGVGGPVSEPIPIEVFARKVVNAIGATIKIQFDPKSVEYVRFEVGTLIPGIPLPRTEGNTVTVAVASLGAIPKSGDGLLGTFHFRALAGLTAADFQIVSVTFKTSRGDEVLEPALTLSVVGISANAPVIIQGPQFVGITDRSAIVQWQTDRAGDSEVEYALDDKFTSSTKAPKDTKQVTQHSVNLTGLTKGMRYFVRVYSSDAQNNRSRPRIGNFFTRAEVRTLPPVLVEGPIVVGVKDTEALIFWRTDEASVGRVRYGTDSTLAQASDSTELIAEHRVQLKGLRPGTRHVYQVESIGSSGGKGTSAVRDFRTAAGADATPPQILGRPIVLARFVDRADIGWQTDRSSTSILRYGRRDTTALTDSVRVAAFERNHRVSAVRLAPGTAYRFQVASADFSGNLVTSSIFEFETRISRDEQAPIITGPPIIFKRTDTQAQIVWGTNEPADSQVEYGTSADSLNSLVTDDAAVSQHSVALIGLKPATPYHFRVGSTDPSGNGPTKSNTLTFRTRALPDSSAPVVTGGPVSLAVTNSGALIRWLTDEPADRELVFGTSPDSLNQALSFADFDRQHNVPLTGLRPGVTYYYQARNRDSAGNLFQTPPFRFTTERVGDAAAPTMLQGPTVRDVTATTATVEWLTDEPSDSRVSYGLTTDYTENVQRGSAQKVHLVTITNLQADTEYHYAVGSADLAGNVMTTIPTGTLQISKDNTFRTLKADDKVPPVILEGPLVEFKDVVAVVTWKTDDLSTSKVTYGTRETFGKADEEVVEDNTLVQEHTLTITNLRPGTAYLFRVWSSDAAGNTGSSPDPTLRSKPAQGLALQPPGGDGSFVTSTTKDTQFPVILKGPTVSAATASSITVEWETDERSNSQIAAGRDSLGQAQVDENNVTKHRFVLTNLSPGVSYQFQIGSTDLVGNGAAKSKVGLAKTAAEFDLTAPVIVGTPAPSYKSDRAATLSWTTDETSNSVVEYGTSSTSLDRTVSLPDPTTQHAAVLTNLTASTKYFYRVSSTDPSANGPTRSAVLDFTTDAAPDLTSPTVTGTKVLFFTDRAATISWTTDETSNSAVKYGEDQTLALTAGSVDYTADHRVALTGLTPGNAYFFKVESIDRSGNKAGPTPTQALTFTTLTQPDTTPPAAPATLSAKVSGGTAVLTWAASPAADVAGYNVSRAEGQGSFAAVATLVSGLAFTDRGLKTDATYRYRVTAVDASGNEGASAEAQAAAAATSIPAPGFYVKQGNPIRPTLVIKNASADGGLTYTFQVSTKSDFSDVAASASGVKQGAGTGPNDPSGLTAWTLDRTLTDKATYYWRARASDGTFDGPFSEAQSFTVNASESARPGDVDGDGKVSLDDFFAYALAFNTTTSSPDFNPMADVDGNGRVDLEDFFTFALVFDFKYVIGPGSSKPAVAALPDEAVRLSFETRLASASKGDEVVARLRVRNIADLRGYGIGLTYDADAVEWVGVSPAEEALAQSGGVAPLFWSVQREGNRVYLGDYQKGGSGLAEGAVAEVRLRLRQDNPKGPVVSITDLLVQGSDRRTLAGVRLEDARLLLTPSDFALSHNYPNPFNPATTIRYAIPQAERVTLRVYNLLGQQVASLVDARQEAGFYAIQWDGKDAQGRRAASGVYFYRMQAGKFVRTEKMLLLK
ncbi:MAG: hypothetical protein A3F84_14020 [Candidatus Handelsmanbacteria bacterium RIFCSPLOWO2_12_FULL_64_10]|uniref:Fibronectin type-III domain-containing protein n=1 Tax=Handelsmanbacteria sp. (strain RIFCSPLOWO2_12_FULL_64_10) TaxID=1817868 RepID=A0A1F6CD10_HANXR|nr:MAG: hypothetical protein A3F84_14020 [Candidatus Handelsmanbacteria bacterium RIFCSPLOWO2_12_FULL_64_10]